MDLSLRGIVGQRYGLTNGFSVINLVLSRAKNDIGEDFYTITSGVSVRFLLTTLVGTLTQHHNNRRTGGYLNEVLLTTSSIQQRFGKLFELPVQGQIEGQIFAQPLYLPNVNIPNQGTHDVLYVATMHNTVYAFVVDTNPPYTLWSKQLVPSIHLPDDLIGSTDYDIEVGIISTPVISLPHNALYVVTTTNDKSTGGYHHFLHALDLVTKEEKFGGPVVISGSVMGTGAGSQNGTINFISFWQNQRPALLLANDTVYIAFASYQDHHPYHGWIIAYNAATLQHTAIFNTTPRDKQGGIWQSGQGPAADGNGDIYFLTGNGGFKEDGSALGDSFVKLNPNLTLADWFSPFNTNDLSDNDLDLGSGGVLLIPDSFLALGGGKQGKFYLVDTQGMGHFNPHNDNQIVQPPFSVGNEIWGGPVYWNGPNDPCVYVWPRNDVIKAFRLIFGLFQTTPVLQGPIKSKENIGVLSLSADGSTPGSGILWASYEDKGQGVLLAMNASSLTQILWNSAKNPLDNVGLWAKWCPPTVANGRVYMASFSGHIAVYGLKGP